jgi:hypothetical protein
MHVTCGAVGIGTLVVSAGIAVYDRRYVPSLVLAVVVAAISAWTLVASLIFSPSTVQNLALGVARHQWPCRRGPDRARAVVRASGSIG